MGQEYYDKTRAKTDPLETMSIKLPKSTIAGLRKIAEHRQRFATFVAREHLDKFVVEELRRLNLKVDEPTAGKSQAYRAAKRKAS